MTSEPEQSGPTVLSWPEDREFICVESGRSYEVLDHGYVKLIEPWGSDERIIESARMSTDKGFLGWEAGECPACKGVGVVWRSEQISDLCSLCAGKRQIPKLPAHRNYREYETNEEARSKT